MFYGDQQKKRVCLLTGASGTFGEAFCRAIAHMYSVAAVYHTTVPALPSQETRFFDPFYPDADVAENSEPIFAIQADLSTAEGCAWAVQATLDQFQCIDLVVHAAAHSVWGNVLQSEALLENAESQFAVNVLAPLRVSSTVARWDWMHHDPDDNRDANRNIISLSSTAGARLYEQSGQSVYGASKAALNHLSCHLADELAPIGVRVNVVAPDSFPYPVLLTDVIEAVTELDASEVTGKVLLLESKGSRWLSIPREASTMAGAVR